MHVEYNASRAIAILVTTALLLNAMMPTLAHAATYLQGSEANANMLVQDAYVQVTYRDNNDQEKLAKGWIDTIGETTFTIREGGFRGKKTITYDKVLSVIMSDESTVPAKQMNEVNRFIREMKKREIEQAKKEKEAKEEQTKREAKQAAIQRLKQRLQDKIVMIGQFDLSKREWYAHVVYTSKEGYKRTAIGQIIKQDTDHIVIRVQEKGGLKIRKTIAYTDIDALVVAQYLRDIEALRRDERKADIKTRPTVARKIGTGLLTGGLCAIAGGFTGLVIGDLAAHNCEGDLCGLEVAAYMGLGMTIGYTIGVPIGVSKIDPHDQFRNAMLGSLLGAGAGMAITSANNQFAMSLVILPLIGATIMSELSRDTYEARRFSVGLAPAPDGNVRAIATLRF